MARWELSTRCMLAVAIAVILGHGPLLFSTARSADIKAGRRIPTVGDDHDYQKLAVNLIAGYGYTDSHVLSLEAYQLDFSTPWGRDALDRQARQGLETPLYDFIRPPGLPLLLASSYAVFGRRTIVARQAMAALLLLTALSLVLLGATAGVPGTVAGFVSGLYHLYFFPGTHDFVRVLTELPAACLVVLFCAFFALYLTGKRSALIPAALALAGAVLTRVNLASAALFIALYLIGARKQIRHAVVFMLALGAPLVTWSIYASHLSGRPILLSTQAGGWFAMTNNIDTLEGIGPHRWNQGGFNPGFVILQDGSIQNTNHHVPEAGENGWVKGLRFLRHHWRDVPTLVYVKLRVGFWFNDGTSANLLQPERLHLVSIAFLLLGLGLRPSAPSNSGQSRRFLLVQLALVLAVLFMLDKPFWMVLVIWFLIATIAACRPYGDAYQPPFQLPTWFLAFVLSHGLTTVVFFGTRMHHPLDPPLMYIALLGLFTAVREIWPRRLLVRWIPKFVLTKERDCPALIRMTRFSSPALRSSPVSLSTSISLRPAASIRPYVQIARIDHWFKNTFMLLGVLLAFFYKPESFTWATVPQLALAFVAACLVASSNYVINELLDGAADAFHPDKTHRAVPSGMVRPVIAVVEWLIIGAAGLTTAFWLNAPFGFSALALWLMGVIYNVPPLRTKEVPYLDVLSESVNNPLRLFLGWFVLIGDKVPPLSLILAYWMVGAFFMATKRFAEYRRIGDGRIAAQYRKSFGYYTENRLLVSMFFYGVICALFAGIFIVRYRVELVLFVPVAACFFAYYLKLGLQDDSPVQHPERLYRERGFSLYLTLGAILFVLLMLIHVPLLYEIFNIEPSRVDPLWTLGMGAR